MTHQLKTALYARYSSDVQKDSSIEDQFATLEKAAKRLGLIVDRRHYYSDRALSGADLENRPGLSRDLMRAAERGEFQAVLVELTDRLSRDESDTHFVKKSFKFYNIKTFTLSGEVSDLQWTFDAHSNADYLVKLAIRVKRGHDQAALKGNITTCAAYGYDCVLHQPGKRVRNEAEAQVIIRIFTEYANGMTPRQIVAGLARDGVLSPSGRPVWSYQMIVGGQGAKRGLLHNQLYRGKYVKNRFTAPKHPVTKKRVVRALDADELITVDMPDLRIVSDDLWNAAHAVRLQRQHQKFGASGYTKRASVPRKQGLLSGLMICGACHGPMAVVASSRSGQRVGCSNAINRKSCAETKSYGLNELTAGALKHMHEHLRKPDFLKEKAKARAMEAVRLAREEGDERREIEKKLHKLDLRIKRLVDAIGDCDGSSKPLTDAINAFEIERVALEERKKYLGDASNVTTLHPAALSAFSKNVDTLYAKLSKNPDNPEGQAAFRNIIDSIIVHPTPKGADYEISLWLRVSAILGGINMSPTQRTMQEIIAAEGLSTVSGEAGTMKRSRLDRYGQEDIILLGRWTLAA